ncbi:cytochrome P450 4C1-like [Bacillus rossius redtenbacheri]|uniref:cytochrome P450 4C1-like n=1 Tax=Bacillus rossius redtenbacheri TaxID=93214 RepID=UPI002FDD59D7
MVGVWEAFLVLLAATSAVLVGTHLLACCRRRSRFARMVNKLPGPPAYPVVGSCLDLMGVPKHRFLEALLERNRKYAPIFRSWVGPMPVVHISDPEYLEVLLSSPKHLEKGYMYRLLHPWLGTGLLTSTGEKWRRHRKLITPAFHFSILHHFVVVFAEKSEVLVRRLQRHADGTAFDVFPLVARCALDIICGSWRCWPRRARCWCAGCRDTPTAQPSMCSRWWPAAHWTSSVFRVVEVFTEKSEVLVRRLQRHADGTAFDLFPLVARCALDIICAFDVFPLVARCALDIICGCGDTPTAQPSMCSRWWPAAHWTSSVSEVLVRRLRRHADGTAFHVFPLVARCALDIICGEVVEVLAEKSEVLVRRLRRHADGTAFHVFPLVARCALDIICGCRDTPTAQPSMCSRWWPAAHRTSSVSRVVEVLAENEVLVRRLQRHADGTAFDVFPLVARCALDIICGCGDTPTAQPSMCSRWWPAAHWTSSVSRVVEVLAEKSEVLVRRLQRHADGTAFDVFPLVARCALDIICAVSQCPRTYYLHLLRVVEVLAEKNEVLVRRLQRHAYGTAFDVFPLVARCALDIICGEVVEVLAEKSEVLVRRLQRHADGTAFDVFPLVARCALDIICGEVVEVLAEKSEVLVRRLQRHTDGTAIDVFPLVARCALDIICETAMGTKINAQDEKDSEYVTAVHGVGEEVAYRTVRPWLHPDCVYFRLPCGRRMKKHLAVIHGFAWKIIAEKKSKLAANATAEQLGQETVDGKKRAAFLDLLLQTSSMEGMTDEEIREEVDTFMFEGYDTTTVAITWSLFLLGLHPDVQARVAEELCAIFAGSERTASMQDLQDMQYLGQVIKEALRLYPSVHSVSRRAACDLQFGQYTVPAGCTVSALIYNTHRDERHFPDPDNFNPENFTAERVRARHPYAYVPFSAGPRNCIGQKFAMLEEKMVLSAVLRRYELRSVEPEQGHLVAGELILRPAAGVQLALAPRVCVRPLR